MVAGLRATAKAVEHPPEPTVGAPVLDPTSAVNLGPSASGKPRLKFSLGKGSYPELEMFLSTQGTEECKVQIELIPSLYRRFCSLRN